MSFGRHSLHVFSLQLLYYPETTNHGSPWVSMQLSLIWDTTPKSSTTCYQDLWHLIILDQRVWLRLPSYSKFREFETVKRRHEKHISKHGTGSTLQKNQMTLKPLKILSPDGLFAQIQCFIQICQSFLSSSTSKPYLRCHGEWEEKTSQKTL